MSDATPTLRDLFSEATTVWVDAKKEGQFDKVLPLLSRAVEFGNETFQVGTHFLKSTDADQRALGAGLVGVAAKSDEQLRERAATALVEALSTEQDAAAAWLMLNAAAATQSATVIPALAIGASAEKPEVRKVAVDSLYAVLAGGIENDQGTDVLIAGLQDPDVEVALRSTQALAELPHVDGQRVRDALWKRLFDPNDDVRLEAIYGLAKRKEPRVETTLEQALSNPEVPARVFDAVIALSSPMLSKHVKEANHSNVSDQTYDAAVKASAEKRPAETS